LKSTETQKFAHIDSTPEQISAISAR